jgi:hypothetical protein
MLDKERYLRFQFPTNRLIFFFHSIFSLLLQGNLEDACSLYEQAIAIEKGKELSQTLPMLYAQYSRFVYMVGWATFLSVVCLV